MAVTLTKMKEFDNSNTRSAVGGPVRGDEKPRLLVVPHMYAENIRVREIELARSLLPYFEVYCLKWSDALIIAHPSPLRRRGKQLLNGLRAVSRTLRVRLGEDGVHYVEAPVLQPVLLRRLVGDDRAWHLGRSFNARMLKRVADRLGIQDVLLASAKFFVPRSNGLRVFFDLVDWYAEEHATAWQRKFTQEYVEMLARCATGVFVVSEPLREKMQRDYALPSLCLPNGADVEALRKVSPAQVRAVRERWELGGKFVIGYIGNHGSVAGVDFLLEAFAAVRRRLPDAVLLIIGPADFWTRRLNGSIPPGVIFTGGVSPAEVQAYFHAIDLGVLAQRKSFETEYAFQIKMVEYSACRKFVISTPLEVWERLRWPHVSLVEPEAEAWAAAIVRLRQARWSPEWDAIVDPYDWKALARRAAEVMLRSS